jgi:hypothetical protein
MNLSVYGRLRGVGLDFTSEAIRRQELGAGRARSAEGHDAHKARACGTLVLLNGELAAAGPTARLRGEAAPCAIDSVALSAVPGHAPCMCTAAKRTMAKLSVHAW